MRPPQKKGRRPGQRAASETANVSDNGTKVNTPRLRGKGWQPVPASHHNRHRAIRGRRHS